MDLRELMTDHLPPAFAPTAGGLVEEKLRQLGCLPSASMPTASELVARKLGVRPTSVSDQLERRVLEMQGVIAATSPLASQLLVEDVIKQKLRHQLDVLLQEDPLSRRLAELRAEDERRRQVVAGVLIPRGL